MDSQSSTLKLTIIIANPPVNININIPIYKLVKNKCTNHFLFNLNKNYILLLELMLPPPIHLISQIYFLVTIHLLLLIYILFLINKLNNS